MSISTQIYLVEYQKKNKKWKKGRKIKITEKP